MALHYRRANELMLIIAASQTTPAHVLEQLSSEDDPQLLEHVAENPTTPVITLGYLAGHSNADVRIAVTHNPMVPADILCALTNDESVDVRFAIASNPLLPVTVIHEICADENPYVAARAWQTLHRILNEHANESPISLALRNIRYERIDQAS